MRESGRNSDSPSSHLVAIASKLIGIFKERGGRQTEKPSFCRVSSDEGSDEGSASTMAESDTEKALALASSLAAACVGNPVVSDSEHDDSSFSTLSLIPKSDQMDDHSARATPEGERIDSAVETCTADVPNDGQRKRPKKRKLFLNPGEMDCGGTLVYSLNAPSIDNDAQSSYSPEAKRRRTESCIDSENDERGSSKKPTDPPDKECFPKPRSIVCTEQMSECSRLDCPSVGSPMEHEKTMLFASGSIVEILGGIYVGRRGVVKKSRENQVLVRVPAFSFQIDRWLEHGQLRLLGDREVLRFLNVDIPHGAERSCETIEKKDAATVDWPGLDRIEPLPMGGWIEDASVEGDGFVAFMSDIFDPPLEADEINTDGVQGNAAPDRSVLDRGSDCPSAATDVDPAATQVDTATGSNSGQTEEEYRLSKKRVTAASFDLQETLEVVTKVIDEVAVACRNTSEYGHDSEQSVNPGASSSENNDTADSNAGVAYGASSQDLSQQQQFYTCGRDEGLNGASCEPDQTSEFVDSSIVEAFAPPGLSLPGHGVVCDGEKVMPYQKTQAAGASPMCDRTVETDCEELLGDLDDQIPTGLFLDGEGFNVACSDQWEPVLTTTSPKGNEMKKRKQEMPSSSSSMLQSQ